MVSPADLKGISLDAAGASLSSPTGGDEGLTPGERRAWILREVTRGYSRTFARFRVRVALPDQPEHRQPDEA